MSMRYPGGLIATSPVNARYPSGVWTQAQAAPYQAQNVWTRDQFWPNTTLLLQGDGAVNGAQNNTFLDSSSNNFTITRNGNTTQGSFTPYEANGYWSNYFDGSSILTFASSTNYVPGSGQFCLECWFFPTTTSGDRWLIGNRNGNYVPFGINYPATTYPGTLLFYISSNGSSWDVVNGTTVSGVNANQWNHFALVRNSSNQFIVYINGVGTTIATNAANFTSAQPFYVGGSPSAGDADFIGYISNTRFVKGDSVYSGNFTPSTAPLTAITNTQLLTSQSNRFIDNSTNAVTPTLTGTPSVQAFQPFPGATTWSASVLGGSGYFDGSGDYLSAAANQTNLYLNGVDSTVEGWFYLNAAPGGVGSSTPFFFQGNGIWSSGTQVNWWVFADGSSIYAGGGGVSAYITASSSTVPVRQWFHLAVVYSSGTSATLYINGTSVATGSVDAIGNNSSYETRIGGPYLSGGGSGTNNFLNGYASNVRIVKGTRVYTANFTPPPAPLTAITNTQLLLSCTNAGIYDNSMMNNLETVGNAQVSTSVVKYGTGSMAFDGNGDFLVMANTPNFAFGTGNFTLEFWINFSNISSYQTIYSYGYTTSGDLLIQTGNGNGRMIVYVGGSAVITESGTASTGVWTHYALVRNGTNLTLYRDGVATGSATNSTDINTAEVIGIGANPLAYGGGPVGGAPFNGYIDDLRVTKGAARYITNFTPPPARMPGQ